MVIHEIKKTAQRAPCFRSVAMSLVSSRPVPDAASCRGLPPPAVSYRSKPGISCLLPLSGAAADTAKHDTVKGEGALQ